MTDTTADTPPAPSLPDPAADMDPGPPRAVTFEPDGTITIRLAGREPLLLPLPTFKQLQGLIRKQGVHADSLRTVQQRALAVTRTLVAEQEQYLDPEAPKNYLMTDENVTALAELRDKARAAANESDDQLGALMEDWWTFVFAQMAGGAVDQDSWPGDLLDVSLPLRMVAHWRFVPAGPG